MDHGWDVETTPASRLCCRRRIVSRPSHSEAKIGFDDPDNVLMARGPHYRLPAEQLRDNALAVSGLLVSKIGGPSVMPYQPAGLWEEAGTGKSYQQSKGEGLYRRSMYTFWRRTSPPIEHADLRRHESRGLYSSTRTNRNAVAGAGDVERSAVRRSGARTGRTCAEATGAKRRSADSIRVSSD